MLKIGGSPPSFWTRLDPSQPLPLEKLTKLIEVQTFVATMWHIGPQLDLFLVVFQPISLLLPSIPIVSSKYPPLPFQEEVPPT